MAMNFAWRLIDVLEHLVHLLRDIGIEIHAEVAATAQLGRGFHGGRQARFLQARRQPHRSSLARPPAETFPRSCMTTGCARAPARQPQAGTSRAEEHADQVVVAPATGDAAGKILHVDLHDRAGVIAKSARQRRIDSEPVSRVPSFAVRRIICRKFSTPVSPRLGIVASSESSHCGG